MGINNRTCDSPRVGPALRGAGATSWIVWEVVVVGKDADGNPPITLKPSFKRPTR